RFLHPRWTSLSRALLRADADVYYQNCAEAATGQVAWWTRRHGRRFVYSVASDMHCDPALPDLPPSRARPRALPLRPAPGRPGGRADAGAAGAPARRVAARVAADPAALSGAGRGALVRRALR